MAELNGVQIREELLVEKGQPIANTEVVFDERHLPSGSVPCDRKFGPARLLTMEKPADCFDGLELVIEVGLEMEFHRFRSQAADGFEAVLLEDGRQIGLCHVISERTVAEDDGALSHRCLLFVPRDNPKSH